MNEELKTPIFFNGKSMGKGLREVAVDYIQTEIDDMISRWFHNESGTDLYTWIDSRQNIIKQQLSFHGQVVEWNCLEGIKTGVIIESELSAIDPAKKEEIQKSEAIHFDGKPMTKSVDLALEILNHLDAEVPFRDQLIGNFKNPRDIQNMAPQDFINRFGLTLKNYQSKDPGFWVHVMERFKSIFKRPMS